jgi:hypothetical protein
MVRVLAEGIGADRTRVWLSVGTELRPAAAWPPDGSAPPIALVPGGPATELPPFPDGERAFPVRHAGELLGAISVVTPESEPLGPDRERLVADVAAQTGLVLRNVRLIEELRESRRRIVAAQDERAKALERNLHDGAQQQLVALAVKQRLAEALVERDPARARSMLADIQAETQDALENLRDLARGIYPPLLADKGLEASLEAQARKAALPVDVEAADVGRHPQEVESAVYFSCLEALQNAAKYARASRATIALARDPGRLRFQVADDGVGSTSRPRPMGPASRAWPIGSMRSVGRSRYAARPGPAPPSWARSPCPDPGRMCRAGGNSDPSPRGAAGMSAISSRPDDAHGGHRGLHEGRDAGEGDRPHVRSRARRDPGVEARGTRMKAAGEGST